MSQKTENTKVVIGGDDLKRVGVALAKPAFKASTDRRAKIDAAAQDFMSNNATLLKKLAE